MNYSKSYDDLRAMFWDGKESTDTDIRIYCLDKDGIEHSVYRALRDYTARTEKLEDGQASTSVIRSLSIGDTEPADVLSVMWKELRVSFMCGISLALVYFVKMLLVDGMLLHNDSVTMAVSATVSLSILFIVMFAKVVGSTLPIAAEKLGVDPAVMANPLISTVTDAVSLIIYIYVAKLILNI